MRDHSAFSARIDPELLPGLENFERLQIPTSLEQLAEFRRQLEADDGAVLSHGDGVYRLIPGYDGDPDVPVTVFEPSGGAQARPAILWIHGGGMIAGTAAGEGLQCRGLSEALGAVVVSVQYRLAPEHRFPSALNDCYAALLWMKESARPLGVDVTRMAVGGGSAGGGLAASVALAVRDRGGPALIFQYLRYPMLDDRGTTASAQEFADIPSWSARNNAFAWRCVLGDQVGLADVSPLAAPARATNLSGLPPALIQVGELDVFRDEDIAYAQQLMRDGVATDLAIYAGAFHGFDGGAPHARATIRMTSQMIEALQRAFMN